MEHAGNILIVDDVVANLKVLMEILTQQGHKVRPATSGVLALNAVNAARPDIIILDARMPEMDGYEVCKILKSSDETKGIPVIFVSGLGKASDKVKAFTSGAQDYITKPYQPDEVKARVITHLTIKRHQETIEQEIDAARNEITALNKDLIETQHELLSIVGEVCESRSEETGQHVSRVSKISSLLARLYGLSEDQARLIHHASPMHDIGKMAIPDSVLKKPGSLSADEWQLMQTHTTLGFNMLKNSKRPIIRLSANIAHEHHEKWDGTGYPRGLSGENICIEGRITAVADVFDALSNKRCYKPSWDLNQIVEFFREQSGRHFDPKLVNLLLNNIDLFTEITTANQN